MSGPIAPATQASREPVIIIIFGITGDLAQRKLLPALYHLFSAGLLHADSVILGITRREVTADELITNLRASVSRDGAVPDEAGLDRLQAALQMQQMSQTDGAEYDALLTHINDIEAGVGVCMNRLYYLSIPPQMFEPIIRNLGQHGHNASCRHDKAQTRLLVEKPFGYDTKSAEALIDETAEWFREDQLFRIDHYVAKETVQNILAFRLFNPLFSTIWNNRHIASIDITAYEQITIEGRAAFYEGVGALRDFIQSHLLQLLTVATMELPKELGSPAIHAAKQKLLRSIKPIQPDSVQRQAVRGQYEGYRDEVGDPDTNTETYASLTVMIDTERWQGVPMTIRTGKAMDRKLTDIRVAFKPSEDDVAGNDSATNELVFNIQPDEGISLHLNAKKPGFADELQSVVMDFNYSQSFDAGGSGPTANPDAYERVLVDAARGDHTLFTTSDEVLSAWRIVENVLQAWGRNGDDLVVYPKGASAVPQPDRPLV
ncbi:MAG TPA: glucose-6-phosphate dehydrogenase [Candidatus Saccharimonadales bacterium]|jgi:glucose-6-phosphate 1-dehydrogenase